MERTVNLICLCMFFFCHEVPATPPCFCCTYNSQCICLTHDDWTPIGKTFKSSTNYLCSQTASGLQCTTENDGKAHCKSAEECGFSQRLKGILQEFSECSIKMNDGIESRTTTAPSGDTGEHGGEETSTGFLNCLGIGPVAGLIAGICICIGIGIGIGACLWKPKGGDGGNSQEQQSLSDSNLPGDGEDRNLPGDGEDSNRPGDGEDRNLPGDGEDSNRPGDGEDSNRPGDGEDSNRPGDGGDGGNSEELQSLTDSNRPGDGNHKGKNKGNGKSKKSSRKR